MSTGGEEREAPRGGLASFALDMARTHAEKIRYLFVGVMNTGISYGMFALMLWLLEPSMRSLSGSPVKLLALVGTYYYLIISWTVWVAAVPISTLNMKYLVFRSPGHPARQVFRAYFVYLPMQGVSTALLWLTVDVMGLAPLLGQLVTIFITTIFSYLGHKYFTFAGHDEEAGEARE